MKRASLAACLLWLTACDGGAISVTAPNSVAFEPDLTVSNERIAVAWYGTRTSTAQIYFRLYDNSLRPLGDEVRLSDSPLPSYEASAAFIDDKLAVAWYDVQRNGAAEIHLGLWTTEGEKLWQNTLSAPDTRSRIPVLRTHGERLFIAWIEDAALRPSNPPTASTLHYAWLRADGEVQDQGSLSNVASFNTWNLNAAALNASTMLATYHAAFETRAPELYVAYLSPESARVQRVSEDDGVASLYPDLALNGTTAALAWFDEADGNSDVKLHVFESELLETGAPIALDHEAIAITQTPGASIGAYLAWSEDVLGLAWNDDSEGQHELYFRSFDITGAPREPARRLTRTRRDSLIPSIEAHEGSFLLSWGEVAADGHDSRQATVMLRRVEP